VTQKTSLVSETSSVDTSMSLNDLMNLKTCQFCDSQAKT